VGEEIRKEAKKGQGKEKPKSISNHAPRLAVPFPVLGYGWVRAFQIEACGNNR